MADAQTPGAQTPESPQQENGGKQKKPFYKKVWFWILIVVIVLILFVSCSSSGDTETESTTTDTGSTAVEQAEEAEEAAVDEDAADSDFEVSIDDCTVSKDYEGSTVAVVTYTWTNNSEDNQMFEVAIEADVFQDGVQLETSVMDEDSGFDTEASWTEIQPGTTQTVYEAYVLESESDISIEVSEWLGNGELLDEASFSVA